MNSKIMRLYGLIFCLVFFGGCIEPYDFRIKNEQPALVVEGYVSNVSYNESLAYPSDGRYFTVKLRYTSDVINVRDSVALNAKVNIVSSTEDEWQYTEKPDEPGTYILKDRNFEIYPDQEYMLRIVLADGKKFESAWEKMPSSGSSAIGSVGFQEVEKQVHVVKAGEREIETIKGVNVHMEVPENTTGKTVFYRWDFSPTWIYIAPLARPSQPDYKCWATNKNFLSGFALQADNTGGYKLPLFFMETIRNERIFENLSVLVNQHEMSEGYYNFWKEMKEQTESGGLSDIPPYNLQTNIHAVDGPERVSGYFGVVSETAVRWYFNKEDLSYYVENTLLGDCQVSYGPGPPSPTCTSCVSYSGGDATNIRPSWWE